MDADFELLEINIEEEYFPAASKLIRVINKKEYAWNVTYTFEFDNYNTNYDRVIIVMDFDLLPDNYDDETESIFFLKTNSIFKVTAGLDDETKLSVYGIFLKLASCNSQGIFAAKLLGTPMANVLPPDLRPEAYQDELLQIINDD